MLPEPATLVALSVLLVGLVCWFALSDRRCIRQLAAQHRLDRNAAAILYTLRRRGALGFRGLRLASDWQSEAAVRDAVDVLLARRLIVRERVDRGRHRAC